MFTNQSGAVYKQLFVPIPVFYTAEIHGNETSIGFGMTY